MTAVGQAAQLLQRLAQVEPLHFAPFYERTRLYRGGVQAAEPEVTLDLTQDCPLDCAFCLAGATRGGGQRLSLTQLQTLMEGLRGLPRLLLVGGEPLAHPQIRQILPMLRAHVRQVEVITGGATLPTDRDRFASWLGHHSSGGPAPLGLTLSVDLWHREAVGAAAFGARIERLLELEAAPPPGLQVRFLVTDPRLRTAGYLGREVVLAVLGDLHPGLAERWQTRFGQRRSSEVFRLGPVVRLGDAASSSAEPLDAGDLAFSGEVVLTPRDAHGQLQLLRALPATWMATIPSGLQRGTLAPSDLASTLEATLVSEALMLDATPELWRDWHGLVATGNPQIAAHLRQAGPRLLAQRWPERRGQWLQAMAQRLNAVCAAELPWTFGVDRPQRRVHVPLLRALWQVRSERDRAFGLALVAALVGAALDPLQVGGWPAFVGYAPQPGLLTDRPDAPVALDRVVLDMGVATPYLGDAWIRPRLVVRAGLEPPDGRPVVRLDGLGSVAWQPGDADQARAGFVALRQRLLQLAPPSLVVAAHQEFATRLGRLTDSWTAAGQEGLAEQARAVLALEWVAAPEPLESEQEVLRLVAGPRVEGWPRAVPDDTD